MPDEERNADQFPEDDVDETSGYSEEKSSARKPVKAESEALAEHEGKVRPASAKDIRPPSTVLETHFQGDIEELLVSYMGDPSGAPDLEEVARLNREARGDFRTPLMTVIEAIVGSRGGEIKLGELAELVPEYWNRPFPASPYAPEEFIYTVVIHSDRMRIRE